MHWSLGVFHGPLTEDGRACLFVFSPYWDKRVQNLDCLCCISILLHLIALLYYNNPELLRLDFDGAAALDRLLVAANVICLGAICLLFAINVVERRFNNAVTNSIAHQMATLILSLQYDLRCRCDAFIQAVQVHTITDKKETCSHLSFPTFVIAVKEALDGYTAEVVYSSEALESLFYTLLLLDQDTDLHSSFMSQHLRSQNSKKSLLSIEVVSAPVSACTVHASMPERSCRRAGISRCRFGSFSHWIQLSTYCSPHHHIRST